MGESLHPITNWPQYNSTLINRGSLTFWIDADAMNNWFHHGRRGRSRLYTDQTVRTFLMLKGIFNLTLRATQRLLDTLFALMNALLCAPDYGCVSKRARPVKVAYRQPAKGRITDLVIDATGLKVFGEGEWKVRKYGAEKRRVWRKCRWRMSMTQRCYRHCSTHFVASWAVFMRMVPMTAKLAIS